jgi:predicted metal-dependent hydrolase
LPTQEIQGGTLLQRLSGAPETQSLAMSVGSKKKTVSGLPLSIGGMSAGINGYRTVRLGDRTVRYTVLRSRRAKHIRLRIRTHDTVEIVAPEGEVLPAPADLLAPHLRWIDRSFAAVSAYRLPSLVTGMAVPYRGGEVHLVLLPGTRISVEKRAGTLRVSGPDLGAAGVAAVLEAWYRRQARQAILKALERWSDRMGMTYGRVAIKDQRSRWGSCSSLGNLNFSWRLILAPSEVLEYVVIHELAHLREPNHSAAFWAIVDHHCPDQHERRRWLRQHGERIAAFLRPTY